jgi:hypothetical protein
MCFASAPNQDAMREDRQHSKRTSESGFKGDPGRLEESLVFTAQVEFTQSPTLVVKEQRVSLDALSAMDPAKSR